MIRRLLLYGFVIAMASGSGFAGGPLIVGGPATGTRAAFGIEAKPFTWDPAKMPIQYRVDPGPMAVNGATTIVNNAEALQRLQAAFAIWQNVSTATISFAYAGPILPAGSYTGGDVTTIQQFNDLSGACKSGAQTAVVFDANGSIISDLGLPPELIGLASACGLDTVNGRIIAALVLLNGKDQDGVSSGYGTSSANYELSANQFDEAVTHETGHLLGLDHSQVNVDLYAAKPASCDADRQTGLPLMFPVEFCAARKDAGLSVLSPDDLAWISYLYPSSAFRSQYGVLSGYILFANRQAQAQGINVVARAMDNPNTPEDESRRIAVSCVSGFLFTGNPGQPVTAATSDNNVGGDSSGSRNAQLVGYYEIPVPVGTYTVEVEAINANFTSLGPLSAPPPLPGVAEFWNKYESAFDLPMARDFIDVNSGATITHIEIILNDSYSLFDDDEDIGWLRFSPLPGSAEVA